MFEGLELRDNAITSDWEKKKTHTHTQNETAVVFTDCGRFIMNSVLLLYRVSLTIFTLTSPGGFRSTHLLFFWIFLLLLLLLLPLRIENSSLKFILKLLLSLYYHIYYVSKRLRWLGVKNEYFLRLLFLSEESRSYPLLYRVRLRVCASHGKDCI